MEYGLAKFEFEGETYLAMGEVGIRDGGTPYYDQRVVAKLKAEPTPLILHDGMEADSAFNEIYDNRFRILLQACNEWKKQQQGQQAGEGDSNTLFSRGGAGPEVTFVKTTRVANDAGARRTHAGRGRGEPRMKG